MLRTVAAGADSPAALIARTMQLVDMLDSLDIGSSRAATQPAMSPPPSLQRVAAQGADFSPPPGVLTTAAADDGVTFSEHALDSRRAAGLPPLWHRAAPVVVMDDDQDEASRGSVIVRHQQQQLQLQRSYPPHTVFAQPATFVMRECVGTQTDAADGGADRCRARAVQTDSLATATQSSATDPPPPPRSHETQTSPPRLRDTGTDPENADGRSRARAGWTCAVASQTIESSAAAAAAAAAVRSVSRATDTLDFAVADVAARTAVAQAVASALTTFERVYVPAVVSRTAAASERVAARVARMVAAVRGAQAGIARRAATRASVAAAAWLRACAESLASSESAVRAVLVDAEVDARASLCARAADAGRERAARCAETADLARQLRIARAERAAAQLDGVEEVAALAAAAKSSSSTSCSSASVVAAGIADPASPLGSSPAPQHRDAQSVPRPEGRDTSLAAVASAVEAAVEDSRGALVAAPRLMQLRPLPDMTGGSFGASVGAARATTSRQRAGPQAAAVGAFAARSATTHPPPFWARAASLAGDEDARRPALAAIRPNAGAKHGGGAARAATGKPMRRDWWADSADTTADERERDSGADRAVVAPAAAASDARLLALRAIHPSVADDLRRECDRLLALDAAANAQPTPHVV
jgi:hypothetical protein